MRTLPILKTKVYLLSAIICMASTIVRAQAGASNGSSTSTGTEIRGVYFDVSQLHHDAVSNGDTWDFAWADDDALYTFNCDGRGYGSSSYGSSSYRNVAFNRLVGDRWNELSGSSVNPMGYGIIAEQEPNGANWKTTGADSIDGVLYAFIANNWYGDQNAFGGSEREPNIRQSVENMSLIKSTDKGKTWTRDAAVNYAHPMWVSRKFSTAYFVHAFRRRQFLFFLTYSCPSAEWFAKTDQ